jgi:hypothetical protein
MPPLDRPSAPLPEALMQPLRRLLRPLVRLLIRSGITFPVLADLLRSLYVEVALRDFLEDRKARTDSRISLLTGIHRKEIRRLRSETTGLSEVPPVVTLGSQIVARWLGTPEYAGTDGHALPLPRVPGPDGGPSFESLVASVTSDVRPRAVLDDWLSQNIVTLDADGRVRLNASAFLPRQGREEQLFYFARNLHDHAAAAVANVLASGAAPFLDRSAHYDRLTADTAARIAVAGRDAVQQALIDVNRVALKMLDANDRAVSQAGADAKLQRVNVGVYVYVEDEPLRGEG